MKKCLIVLICIYILAPLGFSALSPDDNQPVTGSVYFFRLPNYIGSAAKMTIKANDKPVVRLKNDSFYRYETLPGDYIFSIGLGDESRVTLKVEPGKEYYIKCYFNTGLWSGIPILELVESTSGKTSIDGNDLREQQTEAISTKPRYSRIGIVMNTGFGFERFPWFLTENNNEVYLSTGGGFGIGIEYGRQFGKYIDISGDCFFQGSSLTPRLNNASAYFNRVGTTLTPALVIPVKGGEMLRIRLGAGPGIYSMGKMKVDGSKIDGTVLNFRYDTAFGFHGILLFESNFMERGAMVIGLKYSNIRYRNNPDESSHIAPDPKISDPDGSGIDLIFGYSFLF